MTSKTNLDENAEFAGQSITYAFGNGNYAGGTGFDTLVIPVAAEIWASNEDNYTGIEVFDASSSSGFDLIAGNTLSNTIIAGSGGSSLWGGNGQVSDTMTGGAGEDTFWYMPGNGEDFVYDATSADKVFFCDLTMNNLVGTEEVNGTDMKINFGDGNSLTVKDGLTNGIRYWLGDDIWHYQDHVWYTE